VGEFGSTRVGRPSPPLLSLAVTEWIGDLRISHAVAEKLASKHNLDWGLVYDALVCQAGLETVWHDDPQRGRRLLVKILIRGASHLAVLYPVGEGKTDVFNLGSCYPT